MNELKVLIIITGFRHDYIRSLIFHRNSIIFVVEFEGNEKFTK